MKESVLFYYAVLLFLSVGMMVIIVSQHYHLNKAHIGVAFALPPLVYLASRRTKKGNGKKKLKFTQTTSRRLFILFISLFLLCISMSLL